MSDQNFIEIWQIIRGRKRKVHIPYTNTGENGKSAYEIAVENGFVGTVNEWLLSLKGTKGENGSPGSPGRDGVDGADGSPGLSAYEIAVALGFNGTVNQWIASLKGEPGNTYEHPANHLPSIITQDASNRFVSDVEKAKWNGIDLVLSGDIQTGANTTPVTLTGLAFNFEANSKYVFDLYGSVVSGANTTGCGFQIDTSVAVTKVLMSFYHQLANTGTLSGGSSIADDASSGVSSGVPAGNTEVPVLGGGMLTTGANPGTAQFRFRSETTAVTTCKAGTTIRIYKVQ